MHVIMNIVELKNVHPKYTWTVPSKDASTRRSVGEIYV
jgi:hypothetical protein